MMVDGIQVPCFGTLKEIHKALIDELGWKDQTVTINGWAYTVKEAGFQKNNDGILKSVEQVSAIHTGTGVVYNYDTDLEIFEIVTSGDVPHISKRCSLCGIQLTQDEIKRSACQSCYSAECGH